jgi:hypothetical protein
MYGAGLLNLLALLKFGLGQLEKIQLFFSNGSPRNRELADLLR